MVEQLPNMHEPMGSFPSTGVAGGRKYQMFRSKVVLLMF
jgi:hypothetical protein